MRPSHPPDLASFPAGRPRAPRASAGGWLCPRPRPTASPGGARVRSRSPLGGASTAQAGSSAGALSRPALAASPRRQPSAQAVSIGHALLSSLLGTLRLACGRVWLGSVEREAALSAPVCSGWSVALPDPTSALLSLRPFTAALRALVPASGSWPAASRRELLEPRAPDD